MSAHTPTRPNLRNSVETRIGVILRWLIILAIVITCAGPIIYGISLSVRPLTSIINDPLRIIPTAEEFSFDAYPRALQSESNGGFGLAGFMRNSLFVAIGTVAFAIAMSILGAYAAARLRFAGRAAVNAIFLAVYLFPGFVLAVPLFVLFSRIGLRGSLPGLVIIYMAQTVPVALYMLRNYFLSIPESVEEAAMIDGCSRMGVVMRIILPMTIPGTVATALYVFMIAWNEYLYALLFLVDQRPRWTVSLGIAQLSDFAVPPTVLMAGSIVMTLPIVIIFMFAQRALLSGLTAGAEKG